MRFIGLQFSLLLLSSLSAHAGHREDYQVCVDAGLQRFAGSTLPPEQQAAQIVDLHCAAESLEFAKILSLAQAQVGDVDRATIAQQLDLLRDALAAEIRQAQD